MSSNPIVPEPRAERANTLPWPPVLFVVTAAAAWGLGREWPLAWPGQDDLAAKAIGVGFGVAGLALVVTAIIALRRAKTTVMPHGVSDVLVTSGPYGRFRNPIYLGEVLILLSIAEASKNVWFVAAALAFGLLVTVLQILPEERHLAARFGEKYTAYRAHTRRWI